VEKGKRKREAGNGSQRERGIKGINGERNLKKRREEKEINGL